MTKYGLEWPDGISPLAIEFEMIRQGGSVTAPKGTKFEGCVFGEGLFTHYRNAQTICWPEEDHHTWSDLILRTILEERLTVVQGSRDSSKTRTLVKWALIDYMAFPNDTLFLVSSTDVRGLELRVWGDLKDLWSRAFEKFDWLPGNPVDSKHGIFTDALDDNGDIRDYRRSLICIPVLDSEGNETKLLEKFLGVKQKRRRMLCDECFPAGTLVDTPSGKRRIELIQPGDEVWSAAGRDRVIATSEKLASGVLVRVKTKDGREVVCTPEHRFLTNKGWKKAIDLDGSYYLPSRYEAMRSVSQADAQSEEEKAAAFLRYEMLRKVEAGMVENADSFETQVRESFAVASGEASSKAACDILRSLPRTNDRKRSEASESKILRSGMLWRLEAGMVDSQSGAQRQDFKMHEAEQSNTPTGGVGKNSSHADYEKSRASTEVVKDGQTKGNGLAGAIFFVERPNKTGAPFIGRNSRFGLESHHPDKEEKHRWLSSLLQGGRMPARIDAGHRGRWPIASIFKGRSGRQEKGPDTQGAWVDCCEVLEQKDFARYRGSDGRVNVYNLQVERHHSYSVKGFTVANCQFLPAKYLNVLSNLDKGDFKSAFTGNPLGQRALDKVAEPDCGWDNHPEPQKTTTWRNKFDGVTINLVGTDSPNFDPKRPKNYPYLVDAEDVERVKKRFGPDSIEFYSQIKGVRKSGLNPRIVLTPEMCKINGAYDECVWCGEELTNVLGIDAGYGGDACETILITFGKDVARNPVIKFHEPEVIPINLNDPATPEDQIAMQTKRKCEVLKVPYANVFFEAGMRATLAISLARILGSEVNAVNAGGPATTRPVSDDLFVDDLDRPGAKRLKRCDEHYSKFITEMWFSIRLLVECKQARELPKSVVKELSEREWVWARGDRYELETKEDFKLRCHYSPNRGDAAAVSLEGARRLGFQIGRVALEGEKPYDDWLEKELDSHRKFMQKRELTYATR